MEKTNRRLYIRITNRCNRKCSFCYYNNDPKENLDLSLDKIKEIVNKELDLRSDNSGYLRIEVTGGEPSLVENLDEILEYLTNVPKTYITLETNGSSLMSEKFLSTVLKFFNEPQFNFLKISLNTELIEADPNWINNIIAFQSFAEKNKIRYVFNTRFKDQEDRAKLEQIVAQYDIHPSYKDIIYFPIHKVNLYKDGYLPNFGKPAIIYDVDGSEIIEFTNKK